VVGPADGSVYTRASASVDIEPTAVAAARTSTGATVRHGELEVTARATGFRRIRFRTHETLSWGRIDLPEHRHVAGSYWFTLDDDAVTRLRAIGRWTHDPLHSRGPDWQLRRDQARERDGHRCRMCGAPEREDRTHDVHHIRPFRHFVGRAGDSSSAADANDLDNLITLCRSCHGRAEKALGLHGGLTGVGHVAANIAPLYLMCDPRDLGVIAESHAPWTGRPTVAIYERAAAGVGFGEALFDLHETLLQACYEHVLACPCPDGCPSCVGPSGEGATDAKAHALAVLEALTP
jgi:DEAD/DEAH box helicase domain-containing protein